MIHEVNLHQKVDERMSADVEEEKIEGQEALINENINDYLINPNVKA